MHGNTFIGLQEMTETEAEIPINTKKAKKAKKRKPQDAVQEDQHLTANESNTEAVANGPEPQVPQSNEETVTNKNPFATEGKTPKRKKFKKSVESAAQQPENDGDEDMVGLVPKPVLSKRQKKKLKQAQNTEKNKDKDIEKTIAYLSKWNLQRDEWKYEKLRQIFVQKNVFDDKVFDEEQSRIAIEYLATSKGAARENIIKRAEEIIKAIDDKITDENSEELTSSPQYTRAREILQSMQD